MNKQEIRKQYCIENGIDNIQYADGNAYANWLEDKLVQSELENSQWKEDNIKLRESNYLLAEKVLLQSPQPSETKDAEERKTKFLHLIYDIVGKEATKEVRQKVNVILEMFEMALMNEGRLIYECNNDCPDVEYGNCCHPSNCVKKLKYAQQNVVENKDEKFIANLLEQLSDQQDGLDKFKAEQKVVSDEVTAIEFSYWIQSNNWKLLGNGTYNQSNSVNYLEYTAKELFQRFIKDTAK